MGASRLRVKIQLFYTSYIFIYIYIYILVYTYIGLYCYFNGHIRLRKSRLDKTVFLTTYTRTGKPTAFHSGIFQLEFV